MTTRSELKRQSKTRQNNILEPTVQNLENKTRTEQNGQAQKNLGSKGESKKGSRVQICEKVQTEEEIEIQQAPRRKTPQRQKQTQKDLNTLEVINKQVNTEQKQKKIIQTNGKKQQSLRMGQNKDSIILETEVETQAQSSKNNDQSDYQPTTQESELEKADKDLKVNGTIPLMSDEIPLNLETQEKPVKKKKNQGSRASNNKVQQKVKNQEQPVDHLVEAKELNEDMKNLLYNRKQNKSGGSKKWYDKPLDRWQEISKFIDENLDDNFRPSRTQDIPKVKPHPDILMELLPFQLEFLSWAVKQERTPNLRGGILADEMGMGKTIQAISLIMTHNNDDIDPSKAYHDDTRRQRHLSQMQEQNTPSAKLKLPIQPPLTNKVNHQEGDLSRLDNDINISTAQLNKQYEVGDQSSNQFKQNGKQLQIKEPRDIEFEPTSNSPTLGNEESALLNAGKAQYEIKDSLVVSQNNKIETVDFRPADQIVKEQIGKDHKNHETGKKQINDEQLEIYKSNQELQQKLVHDLIEKAWNLHDIPEDNLSNVGKATLVVCPVVAIYQWSQEIQKHTVPGSLKVIIYQGNERHKITLKELEQAAVVLTNYNTLEADYRKVLMPKKVTCKFCRKKYFPDKLSMHLRFFCGPYAMKSDRQAKQQGGGGGHSWIAMQRAMKQADQDENKISNSDTKNKVDNKDKVTNEDQDEGKSDDEDVRQVKSKKGNAGCSKSKQKSQSNAQTKQSARKRKGESSGIKTNKKPGKKSKVYKEEESEYTLADSSDSDEDMEEVQQTKQKQKGKNNRTKGDTKYQNRIDEDSYDEESYNTENEYIDEVERQKDIDQELDGRTIDQWVTDTVREMVEDDKLQARNQKEVQKSFLHEVKWRRIVLDEAHNVKDRQSNTAKAVFQLVSKYKWALSGTPLQNRVNELYSQIRFLRVYPYAYFFCSAGSCTQDCHTLDLRFNKQWHKCDSCQCSRMHHYSWWNRNVANPIKYHGFEGRGKAAMLLLKHEILEKILMRRTKLECADDLFLPPRSVIMRKDKMDEKEHDFYEALYTQSQAHFGEFVQAGTLVNNYAHIFDLLIRLRQAVDHPYLVQFNAQKMKREAERTQTNTTQENEQQEEMNNEIDDVCDICHEQAEDSVEAQCGHSFCRQCLMEYISGATGQATCPTCEQVLTVNLDNNQIQDNKKNFSRARKDSIIVTQASTQPLPTLPAKRQKGQRQKFNKGSIINRIPDLRQFKSSTKLEALWEEVFAMKAEDPSAKAIVFSQYTSMLDLAQFRLEQVGVSCVKLDGSMKRELRDQVIEEFTFNPDISVFLMSLKAGGVALNLTAASHVMLMDPWWNPAVEQQAQDRIHRLGQYKPIKVIRFISSGTIEERILKLQEKKKLIFESTVGKDREAIGSLTVADLKFLFG